MARLGRPSISHATAVGKVMLAFGGGPLPRERDLVALTDRTITSRQALAAQVAGRPRARLRDRVRRARGRRQRDRRPGARTGPARSPRSSASRARPAGLEDPTRAARAAARGGGDADPGDGAASRRWAAGRERHRPREPVSCLCGAVRVRGPRPPPRCPLCHCEECRRWHGHFSAFTAATRESQLVLRRAARAPLDREPGQRRHGPAAASAANAAPACSGIHRPADDLRRGGDARRRDAGCTRRATCMSRRRRLLRTRRPTGSRAMRAECELEGCRPSDRCQNAGPMGVSL